MKISNLKIKNIKCFKEVNIPFEDETGNVIDWSLIVGNNGDGKTTILRCLALGLCDGSSAGGLIPELDWGFLRQGEKEGSIEITLKDKEKKYKLATKIKLRGNSEAASQQIYKLDSSGKRSETERTEEVTEKEESTVRGKIFVVGYGSGRSITGTKSYEEYAIIDSVYSLFNYEYPLQNAELGLRRISSNVEEFNSLKKSLKKILMLDANDDFILSKKGLFVKTRQWGEISFNALSDGYQSMTTAILDFLSWRLLYESGSFNLNKTSGIFIIDEVEQHLHPKWQRNIINLLAKQFSKMQFIGSTHTPICALGLNDLECASQLIKASYVNKHSEVECFDMQKNYKGYRVDQILTSNIFDLESARSKTIQKTLTEYRDIYLKNERKKKHERKTKNEADRTRAKKPSYVG